MHQGFEKRYSSPAKILRRLTVFLAKRLFSAASRQAEWSTKLVSRDKIFERPAVGRKSYNPTGTAEPGLINSTLWGSKIRELRIISK